MTSSPCSQPEHCIQVVPWQRFGLRGSNNNNKHLPNWGNLDFHLCFPVWRVKMWLPGMRIIPEQVVSAQLLSCWFPCQTQPLFFSRCNVLPSKSTVSSRQALLWHTHSRNRLQSSTSTPLPVQEMMQERENTAQCSDLPTFRHQTAVNPLYLFLSAYLPPMQSRGAAPAEEACSKSRQADLQCWVIGKELVRKQNALLLKQQKQHSFVRRQSSPGED